ncbi:MAG: hypothetical protein JRJ16_03075 [Deltaproteobacteria bacterium]|nr:hypothetical protein [Deltaproteobacteria bacterium]
MEKTMNDQDKSQGRVAGEQGAHFPGREEWTRRFIACEPRLSEAVELYREAGFEVRLEPLPPEPECVECNGLEGRAPECRICYQGMEDRYKVIYTRHVKKDDGRKHPSSGPGTPSPAQSRRRR